MSWTSLKSAIKSVIKTNNSQEITGEILQNTLITIVNSVGANATFAGVAIPSTNPGTPDGPVFYLASQAGRYSNFGNVEIEQGKLYVFTWDGTVWSHAEILDVDNVITSTNGLVYDVSVKHPASGVDSGNTYTLSGALSVIPAADRKAGMSIKFIDSEKNKYVQYRLVSDSWSTELTNWELDITKKNLSDDFLGILSEIKDFTTQDYVIKKNGKFGSSSSIKHAVIPVAQGEVYYLIGKNNYTDTVNVAFAYDSSSSSNTDIPLVSGTNVMSLPASWQYCKFVIPEGCTYLLFNALGNYATRCFKHYDSIEDTCDNTPTAGSEKPINSNGVHNIWNVVDVYSLPGVAITDTFSFDEAIALVPQSLRKNGTAVTYLDSNRKAHFAVFSYNAALYWSNKQYWIDFCNGVADGIINVNQMFAPNTTDNFYTLSQAIDLVWDAGLNRLVRGLLYRESSTVVKLAVFTANGYVSSNFKNLSNWNEIDFSIQAGIERVVKNEGFTIQCDLAGNINHTGKISDNQDNSHSRFLPVIPDKVYDIKTYYGSSSVAAVYLYDAAFNPIQEYVFEDNSGAFTASLDINDVLQECPTAKYFRISAQNSSGGYISGVGIEECLLLADVERNVQSGEIDKVKQKIGSSTVETIYTSDNFSGIAYNRSSEKFVTAGSSNDGLIIPIFVGVKYKVTSTCFICSKFPQANTPSSVITRAVNSDTEFTALDGESCIFIGVAKSSFDSVTVTTYGYGIKNDIVIIDNRLDALETKEIGIKGILMKDAAKYDAIIDYRGKQLRQEYWDKVAEGYTPKWYGVQWTEQSNADNVVAINSTDDESLHTTLPIQNKIRRCVTKDNIVQYYLDADNSELKADGTAADLTGVDGNVMVEIPEFFFKIEEETSNNIKTIRIKISEDAIPDFTFSPKRYTSAYEATINRDSGFLASVCTTYFTRNASEEVLTENNSYIQGTVKSRGTQKTARRNGHTSNAATYRGGTNDETLDQYENPSETDYARNQLGIPVANINRIDIRQACDEHQFGYLYDTQRILYMLIQVEFKTRNIQKEIASGGLGVGATQYPSYSAFESFFSPQGGISCLPCGITNALGNHSGEVYFLMENVPIAKSGSGESITYTFGNVWMPCMSYRGVEHYYGHIYKVADQVDCVTSGTTGYVDGHDGDMYWSLHDVSYWYERNPYLAKLNIKEDKNYLGTWNFPCHIMTVSSLLMGKDGHVLHINADGKDYTKNYCDCSELDARSGKVKYITFNGRIVSGNLVGNHFLVSYNSVDGGDKRPSDGTRLDHF